MWKDEFPQKGRYWETSNGILYCGDSIELMDYIPDHVFPLIIVDPPYGVLVEEEWDVDVDTIVSFTKQWWSKVERKMAANSSAYIFWSQRHLKVGLEIFNPHRVLIWHHPNKAIPTNKMFLWTYDPVFYIKKGKPVFNASFSQKENVDVFTIAIPQSNFKVDKQIHKAQKPLRLIEIFVKVSSQRGDIVFDPFLGSGTTAVACEKLNRRWIGIEIKKEYCEMAKERIMSTLGSEHGWW